MLCYDAGKPYTVNPFGLGVRAMLHKGNTQDVLNRIAEKQFGVIETDGPITQRTGGRFPTEVLDAIDQNYVEALKAPDAHFYVPRQGAVTSDK
jgi:hypothetical protein